LHDGPTAACYLYQVHDLTEQKAAAEHLAALAEERMRREASESANALKTEFLARVSHEMRTPLNAVIGFAQLLQLSKGALDPDQMSLYVDHIRGAGEHLLGLVTDLLDLNRAAKGALHMELQATSLVQSVDESRALLESLATAHGIAFETSVAADLRVLADPQRLRQVLLNLGSNAIKYNRQGGTVHVSAWLNDEGAVTLSVQDTGIGMTSEQLARLFQPFDRLGAERTKVPGTGLGLVICRSLVVEMGGSLTLTSLPRSGTAATVILRAAV
jgi:signal transduction histidine kinase